MQQWSFQNAHVNCVIQELPDHELRLSGIVLNPSKYKRIEVIASNPIDRMTNYSGSGLPFPSGAVAFEATPNWINIDPASDGHFDGVFKYPNSYYTQDAKTKIKPSVFVILTPASGDPTFVRLELPDPLPIRTLTYREGRDALGPSFYTIKDDIIGVRTAEETMRRLAAAKMERGLA
jgi:hypothetical protein